MVNLNDERFQKWYEEVRACLDQPTEVIVYADPHRRTAIILSQCLLVQSCNYAVESEPVVVQLPAEMCNALSSTETVTVLPLEIDMLAEQSALD